jgi:hypothetical protein
LDAWDVDRLIQLSQNFKVHEIPVASITEIDSPYWFNDERDKPTVRNMVDHFRLVQEVDMSYPIILNVDGRVMDGMHRVARALLAGKSTIKAVQFDQQPESDFQNCRPEDLPY